MYLSTDREKKNSTFRTLQTIITAPHRTTDPGSESSRGNEKDPLRFSRANPAPHHRAHRIQKLQRPKQGQNFYCSIVLCTVMVTSLIFIDIFPFFFGCALSPRSQRAQKWKKMGCSRSARFFMRPRRNMWIVCKCLLVRSRSNDRRRAAHITFHRASPSRRMNRISLWVNGI